METSDVVDTTSTPSDDEAGKAARWRELRDHWAAHGPPGVLRPGYRAATRDEPVVHEPSGQRVGRHTEHWDGRVDATAEKVDIVANPTLTARKEPA